MDGALTMLLYELARFEKDNDARETRAPEAHAQHHTWQYMSALARDPRCAGGPDVPAFVYPAPVPIGHAFSKLRRSAIRFV